MKKVLLAILVLGFSFGVLIEGNMESTNSQKGVIVDSSGRMFSNSYIYGDIGTNEMRTIQIDDTTHAINTMTYEHHEIHSGSHFMLCGFQTITDDASVTFSVTVPDSAKWPHMTFEIQGTGQTELYIYEAVTGVSGGTTQNAYNNNRNSSTTSNLLIKTGVVITGNGTLIFSQSKGLDGATPSKADSEGIIRRDREVILKQNATTLFVITSRTADNVVSYCGEWYEHESLD